ncbi:MAG: diguanylate cyclase [Idiomarina sp.]|nr:diguanylate cyclase [Idiomarina sp.]
MISRQYEPFLQSIDYIGDRRLGLISGYRVTEFVETYYPDVEFTLWNSEKEALLAVSRGRSDVTIASMLSANSYIAAARLDNLKISGWAVIEDRLSMGVRHELAHLLPTINEALDSIDHGQRLAIYQQWSNVKIVHEPDYRMIRRFIAGGALVLALIGIYLFGVYRFVQRLKRKNEQLEDLRAKLQSSNTELEYISTHDPLIDLFNRHHFYSEMQRRTEHSDETCVLVIDLDHFKQVNDEFGHGAGDESLKLFAALLREHVRDSDVVARWGGEEFVVLCPHTSPTAAKGLAERLLEVVRKDCRIQGKPITCSIGGAQLIENEDINQCLERADQALYVAKAEGRDRFHWAD